jgi:hypothetical protein
MNPPEWVFFAIGCAAVVITCVLAIAFRDGRKDRKQAADRAAERRAEVHADIRRKREASQYLAWLADDLGPELEARAQQIRGEL